MATIDEFEFRGWSVSTEGYGRTERVVYAHCHTPIKEVNGMLKCPQCGVNIEACILYKKYHSWESNILAEESRQNGDVLRQWVKRYTQTNLRCSKCNEDVFPHFLRGHMYNEKTQTITVKCKVCGEETCYTFQNYVKNEWGGRKQ